MAATPPGGGNDTHGDVNPLLELEKELLNPDSDCYIENVLDIVSALVSDCNHPAVKSSKQVQRFLHRFNKVALKIDKCRTHYEDFDLVKVIGQGGFGRVQLVRHKTTKRVFAMKIMTKQHLLDQTQAAGFWEERDIMAKATSEWLVMCHKAFMDKEHLYICMEYMPGGDLYYWLEENETLTEEQTQFYIAETVLALQTLHGMGYVHRDLKPDNMLLDGRGHLKLADFGSCVALGPEGYHLCTSPIGTPDYISPEMLNCQSKPGRIGPECDWWAVGVIIYEMIFGEPAFYGQSLVETYGRILSFEKSLSIPEDTTVSPAVTDLIRSFLRPAATRLGHRGVDEVKQHPFFHWEGSVTWETIRHCTPPIDPDVSSDVDTKHISFDERDVSRNSDKLNKRAPANYFTGDNLAFAGFTFNRDHRYLGKDGGKLFSSGTGEGVSESELVALRQERDQEAANRADIAAKNAALERKVATLDVQTKDWQRKLAAAEKEAVEHAEKAREVESKHDEERRQRERLAADLDRLQDTCNQLRNKAAAAHEALETDRRAAALLREDLEQRVDRLGHVESERAAIERRLTDVDKLRAEAEALAAQLQQTVETERAECKALRDAEKALDRRNRDLENQMNQLTARVEQLQLNIAMADEARRMLEKKNENMTLEIDKYKAEFERERGDHEVTIAKLNLEQRSLLESAEESNSREIGELRDKLEKEREQRSAIEMKIGQISKENDELFRLRQQAETQVVAKDMELSTLTNTVQYLKRELLVERDSVVSKEDEVKVLTDKVTQLRGDVVQVRETLAKVEEERTAAVGQLETLRKSCKKHEQDVAELNDHAQTLQAFIDVYRNQITDLEETATSLRGHVEQLTCANQATKTELDKSTSELRTTQARLDSEVTARKSAEGHALSMESSLAVAEVDMRTMRDTHTTDIQRKDVELGKLKTVADERDKAIGELRVTSGELRDKLVTRDKEVELLQGDKCKLQREYEVQKKLVGAAVGKLHEHLTINPPRKQQKPKKDTENYKQLEKELKNLQATAKKNEDSLRSTIDAGKHELNETKRLLTEATEQRDDKEKQINELTKLVNTLYSKLDAAVATGAAASKISEDTLSELSRDLPLTFIQPMEGVIDTGGKGRGREKLSWNPKYAVLKPYTVLFYNSKAERDSGANSIEEIPLSKIVHVREELTPMDVIHAKPTDITKIFQIFYDPEPTTDRRLTMVSTLGSGNGADDVIIWHSHKFHSMYFRVSTLCDVCNRPCSDLRSPPEALECVKCRFRIHRDHVDKHQKMPPCNNAAKILLVRATSDVDKKAWVKCLRDMKQLQKDEVESLGFPVAMYRSTRLAPATLPHPGQTPL